MSVFELRTVIACVDAITSSYQEGIKLLRQIHAKRKSTRNLQGGPGVDTAAHDLEQSLQQGVNNVRGQYDRNCQRFGSAFAKGDQIAIDALTAIIIQLQQQIIASLETQEVQVSSSELTALQDASDASQDKCVLVLMQLQQRIITSGPGDNITPPPLKPCSILNRSLPPPPKDSLVTDDDSRSSATSPQLRNEGPRSPTTPRMNIPPSKPLTPPHSPQPPILSTSRTTSRASTEQSMKEDQIFNDMRPASQNQYRPMATTVTKTGFFGFGKRTKVEPVIEPPENPLVDEYLATAILDEYRGMERAERANSMSTVASSYTDSTITQPRRPSINILSDRGSPTSQQSPNRSLSTLGGSIDSWRRSPPVHQTDMEVLTSNRSLSSIKPEDLLPSEMNQYGGFCKGAWRQQIGDKKRAMEERTRPGGMYNAARYWQCRHCKFEGRLFAVDKKTSRYDMRVFRLVDGIQFRWEFMFKSHLFQRDTLPDPTKATFGCIFCCSEGRGTPTFDGLQAFMIHLIEHRDPLPTGEALYRMNCLVGRQAGQDEDFDINFVSKEGGLL